MLQPVLDQIAAALGPPPVRVGIDGRDGAGKTTFAGALAAHLRAEDRAVHRIEADDFLNPAEVRYRRGRHDPEGFFLDSYDLKALIAAIEGSGDEVCVVDGLFLHRAELRELWDVSVFLHVEVAVSVARLAARDGSDPDPASAFNRRYIGGHEIYFERCDPRTHATFVIESG